MYTWKGFKSTLALVVLGVATALLQDPASAQTTAPGPYYATPSWDQTLPASTRFVVLSNMNNEAVLDRDTGLVWERSPFATNNVRTGSEFVCWHSTTGGRQGWRLPGVDELTSLADATNSTPGALRLPVGHPFLNVRPVYWAADRVQTPLSAGGVVVIFQHAFSFPGALVNSIEASNPGTGVWCVRGGAGTRMQ